MNETDHYNFFKHYCMLRFVQVALFIFSCINGFVQGQIEPVLNENSIKIIESRIVDSILNVERVNLNGGAFVFGQRSGDSLSLKMNDGKVSVFVDSKKMMMDIDSINGNTPIVLFDELGVKNDTFFETINYRLIEVLDTGKYYLLTKTDDNSGGQSSLTYVLINRNNGTVLDVNTYPLFSLDKKRFIDTHGWEPSDGNILGIKIYNTMNDEFIEEFYIVDEKFEYSGVSWVSNDKFKIDRVDSETGKPLSPIQYKWNGRKWVLS